MRRLPVDASSLPTIQDLLVENIPRELVLSLEEALEAASVRADKWLAEGVNP